jgi:hypothetical protein
MPIGTMVKNYLKNYLIQVVTASPSMSYHDKLIVSNANFSQSSGYSRQSRKQHRPYSKMVKMEQ